MGYSDAQIAWILRINEHEVTRQRYKLGIRRTYKMVDTCAAEFEAKTPYFYSTFDEENEKMCIRDSGKLNRFFKDNTLLAQAFVKDNSLSVEALSLIHI